MSFTYNDKDMGVVYKDIPDKVVPAICVYARIELMCTKYKFE